MADAETVTVWRVDPRLRLAAIAGGIVVAILAWRIFAGYGVKASIAVLFAAGIIFYLWWGVLRPKLAAGPDGVEVVLGRSPTKVAWKDIRRVDAGASGVLIRLSGGTEVLSRWPQRDRGAKPTDVTEADRVAAYLIRRADWARKPDGPVPVFVPTPPAPKTPPAAKGE